MEEAFGEEYDAYRLWWLNEVMPSQEAWFDPVAPEEFGRRLSRLNYNNDDSIYDFEDFLYQPNMMNIVLGKVGDSIINFAPEPTHLEPHELDEYPEVEDNRMAVSTSILGLYTDKKDYMKGIASSEGSDSSSANSTPNTMDLGVFQQLGLLYSRGPDNMPSEPDDEGGWSCTNYVLVINVYDDSIWVLWRRYIYYPETNIYTLAKSIRNHPYAIFPGRKTGDNEENRTIICAKIADNWTALEPGDDNILRFQQILGADSAQAADEDPLLVCVRRTAEGGLRGTNDFRDMGPRAHRADR